MVISFFATSELITQEGTHFATDSNTTYLLKMKTTCMHSMVSLKWLLSCTNVYGTDSYNQKFSFDADLIDLTTVFTATFTLTFNIPTTNARLTLTILASMRGLEGHQ